MEKTLRPYQQNIVDKVLGSDKDLIICLPTGAGKTVIASALMENLPGTCLFIVPRLELIGQAKDEFGDVDVIWANKTSLTGKKAIIASKDSLRTQLKKLTKPDSDKNEPKLIIDGQLTVIFDEAHVSIKQTYALTEFLRETFSDIRILGLTATPERMDGFALLKGDDTIHKYGVFDRVLQEETVQSLIDKEFLVPLRYFAKPIEGITNIKPDTALGEELSEEQMNRILTENNVWGDLVACYEEYGKGRPAIGFTVTVTMAEEVARLFQDAGYDFRVIHGEMSVAERENLITSLHDRKIDGLVNAALLTYGFDCPPASYAFSVRHIKSRPLWFQMVGRILRLSDGKPDAIFMDHGDSISEFAEPANPLPILAPIMDWRVDGENKEQKQIRKKGMKRAQEAMRAIQELSPMPADMVEITPEDINKRLADALLKLRAENGSLRLAVEAIKKQADELKAQNDALKEKYKATIKEKERIAEDAEIRLRAKEALLAAAKSAQQASTKVIDEKKTFDYIRANYCRYRNSLPDADAPDEQHLKVMKMIYADEPKLDFYFDRVTMSKSFSYWRTNYKKNYQRPVPQVQEQDPFNF